MKFQAQVYNCLWTDVNNIVTPVAGICYAGHRVVYFAHLIRGLHTWGILNTEGLWTAIHSLAFAKEATVSTGKWNELTSQMDSHFSLANVGSILYDVI